MVLNHRVLSYWTANGAEGPKTSISTQGEPDVGTSSSGKVILSALYQTTRSTKKANSIKAPVVPLKQNASRPDKINNNTTI